MLTKRPTTKDRQVFLRYYRDTTGESGADPIKVAEMARAMGWPDPPPIDPVRRSAKLFARAARKETKHDAETGDAYRANVAVTEKHGETQFSLWYDVDDPATTRPIMLKGLIKQRDQMVGEAVQIDRLQEHWNRVHPDEDPLQIPMDLTPDVLWEKNAPRKRKAS